ncbi:MAG TPA: DUF881 domain-containing protein [Actinomycetota bacterium]|nr:DUF881 domain-containing protein [Actinomycetota bacterium]
MSATFGLPESEERWLGGRRPSMRPPARIQSRVAVAAVAVAVGFLAAVQAAGGGQRNVARLAAERPEDLTRILADLNEQADELSRQVSSLRVQLLRYRGSARSDELALRDARQSLEDLQVLAGTVPVQGPGLTLTVSDPGGVVGWEPVLDLVQELRDAGAEAIAVDEIRVVASTWFGPAEGGGISVDGVSASPPYDLEVIGPAGAIGEALRIPGGPLTVLDAQSGVSVDVAASDLLELAATEIDQRFAFARAPD